MTAPCKPAAACDEQTLRPRILPTAAGLAVAQRRIRVSREQRAVPAHIVRRAVLLIEQIVMNVGMHGFDSAADPEVDLSACAGSDRCRLPVMDAGKSFDPTARRVDGVYARLDGTRSGELGRTLLRRLADNIRCLRLPQGLNELTILLASRPEDPDRPG